MSAVQTISKTNEIIVRGESAMVHYPRRKAELSVFNEISINSKLIPISELKLIGAELNDALVPVSKNKSMGYVDGLMAQYKKSNIDNPKIFLSSMGNLFCEYPEHAVARVCLELPRKSPFSPSISDAKLALDSIVNGLKRDLRLSRIMYQKHEDRRAEKEGREARRLERKNRDGEEGFLDRLKRQYAEKQAAKNTDEIVKS